MQLGPGTTSLACAKLIVPFASFSAAHPLHSQRVKTPCHIISESPKASPTPQSAPTDPSNSLIVSVPMHCCNPTISIQPIVGSSRKQG